MGYDLQRAGVTLLCVVSLLLAASLFPATGFGDYPSWSPGGVAPGDDGGSAGPGPGDDGTGPGDAGSDTGGDEGEGDGDTTATTTDDGGGETTTSDGESTTGAGGETTTSDERTTTTTTSATTTTTGGAGGPDDDEAGLIPMLLSSLATVLYVAAVGVGLVGFFGAIVAVAALLGVVSRRRHESRADEVVVDLWMLPEISFSIPVGSTVQGVPQVTTAFLVGVGNSLPAVLDDLASIGGGLTTGFGTVLTGVGRSSAQLFVGIPKGLVAAVSGAGSLFSGSLLAVPSGLSNVGSGLLNPFGDEGTLPGSDARDVDESSDDGLPAEEPEEQPPQTVEEAWVEMVEYLPVRNRDAKTPAELARIAVSRGFPREAVGQLTAAYRDVRYGGHRSSNEYLKAARAAFRRIQDSAEGE